MIEGYGNKCCIEKVYDQIFIYVPFLLQIGCFEANSWFAIEFGSCAFDENCEFALKTATLRAHLWIRRKTVKLK